MTGPVRPQGRPPGCKDIVPWGAQFAWDGVGAGSPRGQVQGFFVSGTPRIADLSPPQPSSARLSLALAWSGRALPSLLGPGWVGREDRGGGLVSGWGSLGGGLWLRVGGQGGLCHFKDLCLQFCIQGSHAVCYVLGRGWEERVQVSDILGTGSPPQAALRSSWEGPLQLGFRDTSLRSNFPHLQRSHNPDPALPTLHPRVCWPMSLHLRPRSVPKPLVLLWCPRAPLAHDSRKPDGIRSHLCSLVTIAVSG